MTDTNSLATARRAGEQSTPAAARTRRRFDVRSGVEIGALLLLVVIFSVLNQRSFPTVDNLRTILDQAATPLIIGVGATLVILLGCIDLSVEGLMSVCGLAFVLLSANSRGPGDLGIWAIVIGIGVGALLGLANGLVHTLLSVPSFIVTLGMGFVAFGLATILFGESQLPFLRNETLTSWPVQRFLGFPYSFWLAFMFVAVGALVSRYTRIGRYTYAIGDNELIARHNGVPVNRYKILVFTIAGACSGMAGILGTMELGSAPARIGIGTLFLTIAAVVIGGTSLGGGRGGILRTAVGVLLLTVLNNGLILSGVSPNVQSGVSGGILIIAIVAAAWPYRGRLRIVK